LKAALPSELHANVYIGMRYSPPTISDALLQAMKDGVDTILLLPLYPQYSLTTTYSSLKEVERQKTGLSLSQRLCMSSETIQPKKTSSRPIVYASRRPLKHSPRPRQNASGSFSAHTAFL